jgi:hypothetical protein
MEASLAESMGHLPFTRNFGPGPPEFSRCCLGDARCVVPILGYRVTPQVHRFHLQKAVTGAVT